MDGECLREYIGCLRLQTWEESSLRLCGLCISSVLRGAIVETEWAL